MARRKRERTTSSGNAAIGPGLRDIVAEAGPTESLNDAAPSPPGPAATAGVRAHLAIALISLALLITEIALMRVFSILYWYYFAFFAISLALLGGAAAAATLTAWERRRPGTATGVAAPAAAACALSAVAAPLLLLGVVQPALAGSSGTAALVLTGALFFVPFYSGGLVIASLLTRHATRPGSLYWADLAGAAAGCLVAVPLLWLLPAPGLLAACGIAAALAALSLTPGPRSARFVRVTAAMALVGSLVVVGLSLGGADPLEIRYSKGRQLNAGRIAERWTPLARLTVYDKPFFYQDPARAFMWGPGAGSELAPLEQYWIDQDETAGTPITRWDGDPAKLAFLAGDVTNAAYLFRSYERVLAIGTGGGRDVLAARHFGARAITAVELNAAMIDLVDGQFGDYSGRPYSMPGVETVVAEARSWIARAEGRQWDLVQLSLVDSWAASMAGAFALAENTLYTREAFETFLSRLAPDGLLTVSRWYPAEGLRLTQLAATALEGIGATEPRRHIAVVRGGGVATLIASRRPFEEAEIERLEAEVAARGFQLLAAPGRGSRDPLYQGLLNAPDRTAFLRQFPLDFSVPTDDRPYFFLFWKLFSSQAPEADPNRDYPQDPSGTLVALLGLLAAVATGLIALPLLLSRPDPAGPPPLLDWPYFAALGLGFMLVELALVQRFVLYLGHPTYATSVVFFGMLISAACGSLGSAWLARRRGALNGALVGIGFGLAMIALHGMAIPSLLDATLGWSTPSRVAVALFTLLPLGAALGTALPLGLARLANVGAPGSAPYALGVNAVFSVLATVLATAISISWGNSATLLVGFAAYVLAAAHRVRAGDAVR